MTQSRPLLPSSSLPALVLPSLGAQGQYGAITALARDHGISRQTVYKVRNRALDSLKSEFAPDEQAVPGSFVLQMAPADIKRAIVALRVVAPASVRDIVELIPTLFRVRWSYGKVWGVLHDAEQRAASLLQEVDLSGIKNVALDEMFSQGRPVLAGIDLDTQYVFQVEVHGNRSGDTWAESLGVLRDHQNLEPHRVVKDAGTGLGAGVRACWPGIEEHDDLFHALYKMGQEAYHLERGAYRAINAVDELQQKRKRARTEVKRRSLGQKVWKARKWMDGAIERFDRFETLRRQAEQVLELADRGSGQLRTSTEVVDVLTQVSKGMLEIRGKRIRRIATYIGNRAEGLGRYLDSLALRLQEVEDEAGGKPIVEATLRAYQASLMKSRVGPDWDRRSRHQELLDATQHLLATTARDNERLMKAVGTVMPTLANRYRASSAIENLNSVLRPYLVVQKHAQQGFLHLFQYYWNHRERHWGRWKGTSAYEQLTGNKVDDWLSKLGFKPSRAEAPHTA